LGGIWYDNEINSKAARRPRLGRAGDGHQRSSSANHARRPLRDLTAEDIENQIDLADVFQGIVFEVEELLCAEVESRLTGGSAPGADDIRAGLTCELARHRTDYAGRTVHEDALPRMKAVWRRISKLSIELSRILKSFDCALTIFSSTHFSAFENLKLQIRIRVDRPHRDLLVSKEKTASCGSQRENMGNSA
jgi:hypothetical protein